jgi:hypothetical protein
MSDYQPTPEDRERFFKHRKSKVSPPRYNPNRKLPPGWEDAQELRQKPIPLSELAMTSEERDRWENGED